MSLTALLLVWLWLLTCASYFAIRVLYVLRRKHAQLRTEFEAAHAQLRTEFEAAGRPLPCVHKWRVLATSVTPPVHLDVRGIASYEFHWLFQQQREAAEGSTRVIVVCDSCGSQMVHRLSGKVQP